MPSTFSLNIVGDANDGIFLKVSGVSHLGYFGFVPLLFLLAPQTSIKKYLESRNKEESFAPIRMVAREKHTKKS